jgi:SAM-dependent methyltransferase
MDFSSFDRRGYPVVSVEAGYGEWANNYDATVTAGLDQPLLDSLTSVNWRQVRRAADLACGTGRTGVWLKNHGVASIHGVDLTQQMLDVAASKHAHEQLHLADVAGTPLPSAAYDLCMLVLADEHLAELEPVYREAARLLVARGHFVLIGYHPFFLMRGMPTHYHRCAESREAITIRSYVHLFSEHFTAASKAGMGMTEFRECVIDEKWLAGKPKWREYVNWPVSFALVWTK